MARDDRGRFTKANEDRIKININFPSIKKIILWALIVLIFMPWISIIRRSDLPAKLLGLFDELITQANEAEKKKTIKKMVYLVKYINS